MVELRQCGYRSRSARSIAGRTVSKASREVRQRVVAVWGKFAPPPTWRTTLYLREGDDDDEQGLVVCAGVGVAGAHALVAHVNAAGQVEVRHCRQRETEEEAEEEGAVPSWRALAGLESQGQGSDADTSKHEAGVTARPSKKSAKAKAYRVNKRPGLVRFIDGDELAKFRAPARTLRRERAAHRESRRLTRAARAGPVTHSQQLTA